MQRKVKFLLVLATVFFLYPFSCTSQFIMLGLKTGVGLSGGDCYMNGKLFISPGTSGILTNFNGGITLNLKINERWIFHSEILVEDKANRRVNQSYISFSGNVNGDTNPHSQVIRNHMFYLHFPQTIRFLIPLERKRRNSIYVEMGPYFACYLISKDVIITTTIYSRSRGVEYFDMTETSCAQKFSRTRLDWGVTVGLGYLMRLWKGQLDSNIKLDHMLQPFTQVPAFGSRAYQYVFATTIGYALPVLQKAYK